MKTKGHIIREGMGGFLNPPTHPEYTWSVETDLRRRPENRDQMSLQSAVDCEWLDPATRTVAKRLLSSWHRPPLESVHDWVLQVLGYFHDCYADPMYSNTEEGWHADKLLIDPTRGPLFYPDCHAGVHHIRKYYPEYVPTADDFANAYWGSKQV